MFANVDLSNQQVRAELFRWIEWLNDQMPLGGLRLDAIKHMSTAFVKDFTAHVKKVMGRQCILAGECKCLLPPYVSSPLPKPSI